MHAEAPLPTSRPGPALALVLLAMVGVGGYLWWGQNVAGHSGGHISIQKVFWFCLAVTLFVWMPLFITLDRRVGPVLRRIVSVYFILWALRVVAELWLCYGVHRWIPPYGVIHNLTCMLVLTFLMWRHREVVASYQDPASRNAVRYLKIMRAGMLCECVFAEMFYYAVDQDTTNTWFANMEPRFWLINRLTLVADLVLYPLLYLTVRDYYRGTFTALPALTPAAAADPAPR
jgi:hypothetical protein